MSDELDRFNQAVQAADDAFWAVIGALFPEAKSGDFPPDAHFEWERARDAAVRTWVDWNVGYLQVCTKCNRERYCNDAGQCRECDP